MIFRNSISGWCPFLAPALEMHGISRCIPQIEKATSPFTGAVHDSSHTGCLSGEDINMQREIRMFWAG